MGGAHGFIDEPLVVRQRKLDVLRAFPQHEFAERLKMLMAFEQRKEVVAGKLAHFARKDRAAVDEQEFSFAESAGIQKDIAACFDRQSSRVIAGASRGLPSTSIGRPQGTGTVHTS